MKYVDELGNPLAEHTELTGELDSDYEVSQKEIDGYELVTTDGNAKGKFEAEIATVTFIYKKVNEPEEEGQVVTKYVDQTGKEIAQRNETSGKISTNYTTIQKDIAGYRFVEVQGNPFGAYSEGVTTVIYVYERMDEPELLEGMVIAKYIDEDGKEIAKRNQVSGKVGTTYTTVKKSISGYEFVEVNGVSQGEFSEGRLTVTYVYKKVADSEPTIEGTVITKYVDESGKEIAFRNEATGEVETEYSTMQKEIPGYTFRQIVGEATGKYADRITEVTYVYEANPDPTPMVEGKVITKYVDEKGNEIAERQELTAEVGTDYTTKQKEIIGYRFVEVSDNAQGKYVEGTITVVYMYTAIEDEEVETGQVIVKYVDQSGKEIYSKHTMTGKVGTPYKAEKINIPGYKFTHVIGNPSDKYGSGTTIVTYVYEKMQGNGQEQETDDSNETESKGKPSNTPPKKENNLGENKHDKETKTTPAQNNGQDQTKQPNQTSVDKSKNEQGKTLPNTATSMFAYLLAGMIVLSIGGTLLFFRRKRA